MHTDSILSSPLYRFEGDGASSPASSPMVTLFFEDRPISVPEGTTVAAALLLSGVAAFRTSPVTAAPRAPYCMMGVCFECLVEVDGVPARQACLTPVKAGMKVRRQSGARGLCAINDGGRDAS